MTFVVAGRARVLRDAESRLTGAGAAVEAAWSRLPTLYPRVVLDELAIMSDHVHAIIWLEDLTNDQTPLGEVVRGWKASSTRVVRLILPAFRWQSHYQDWIIRDQTALSRIRRYIRSNPLKAG